ncbi:hypothetical protein CEUSTIGMA_g7900.t1 [Chlamydomonas eustigma]|uniref:Uncharacterized protein n=1 Tax=Chlamydomonas eustigma TaxID=1157962 RepID=A0A250XBJ7_9CHLO|nr:hypothetical protein CEUSTIGMA_g7900.t1 [Chlamydomonas eustigma]|eukprot:GAX80461.1 hypothetical protein CEUSTIGMA_g7900.t1 [Chlamydomonas eustigma]
MSNGSDYTRLLLLPISCLLLGYLVATKMMHHISTHKVMLFVLGPNHDPDTRLRWSRLVGTSLNSTVISPQALLSCQLKYRPVGPHPLCDLGPDNVIQTRRQLMKCQFRHVVITPLSSSVWSAMQSEGNAGVPLDPKTSPFPVVQCQSVYSSTAESAAEAASIFFTSSDLDGPPCIRPSGRESGGYAGFISQNYDHLPEMMYFTHGHENSWHQDLPMTEILAEFCEGVLFDPSEPTSHLVHSHLDEPSQQDVHDQSSQDVESPAISHDNHTLTNHRGALSNYHQTSIDVSFDQQGRHLGMANTSAIITFPVNKLPLPGLYVSLNNQLFKDWRLESCFLGLCGSAKTHKTLARAWKEYFEDLLGSLPDVLSHFCCSQFAVSRSRVRLRPAELYHRILMLEMGLMTNSSRAAGQCLDQQCCRASGIMEVLWSTIFGEEALFYDHKLGIEYPNKQESLPPGVVRAYRQAWKKPVQGKKV